MTTRAKEISDLGNTGYLEVDANGNVGIGTDSPQKPLDVVSGAYDFVTVGARGLGINEWTGIHFGYRENNTSYRKSAIVFERTDLTASDGQGKIHILNGPQGSGGSATLADAKITIAENGNVGIGESNPVAKTHIQGSGTSGQVTASLILENSSSGTLGMDITGSAGSSRLRFLYGGGPSTGTNALTEAMNIVLEGSNAGNVGIGTETPNDVLTIQGADNGLTIKSEVANRPKITLMNGTSGMLTISANGTYGAIGNSSDANRYMAFNGDNVGVGTTTPGYKFQVNGISHTRGLITNPTAYGGNSGSGTRGNTTLGAGKYWDTTYSAGYMHIVLPSRYNDGNSKMFFLEVKGYDFSRPGIIDLKYGGYVTPPGNGGPISRSVVLDNYGGYNPAVYYSSNYGAGVCRFYWPVDTYYGSFTINTIASGNGDVIEPDELQIILSSSSTI